MSFAWSSILRSKVSHGQKAVDPLKPEYVDRPSFSKICLPRSEGRGPIEASWAWSTPMILCKVSHGQKAVDPLKHVYGRRCDMDNLQSPTVRRPWTH